MTVSITKLGAVAEIIAGQSPPSSTYNQIGEGLPFYQGKADFGEWNPKTRMWCSAPVKISLPGDVLISVRAPVGPTNLCQEKSCIGRGLGAIRVKPNLLDNRYLIHFIRSIETRITLLGRGSTFSAITRGDLENIEIPLPPLAEQKRIAAILDKADAIRRKLQQSLRLSDDFLRSVFLDMFGDPVTNPKGWQIARMGDYSDQLTGFAFKSSEYVQAGDGIRLCRGTNVLPCEIDWSDRADWPEDQCSQLERYRLIEGDIVVAMDRPWISSGFKTARITKQDIPSLLVQRVARIRAKKPLNNNYLFCLVNQGSFSRHCKPTETTIPHISPVELREFPIAIPDVSLLEKFDRIFLKQSHAKESVKKKLTDAEHLFSSLQQLAFRGEL